ncbi:MAG: tetratricopeptide repeat protein [Desulfobacterales bacterium]|nr:tetratricopeptide repeat protein [Desulfobacterales bacterium]
MAKKITRKELLKEPDEFLTLSAKAIGFATENKDKIMLWIGGVIVLILIISGIAYKMNRDEKASYTMLYKAMQVYDAGMKNNGPEKVFQDTEKQFDELISRYASHSGGKIGCIQFANICYTAGNTEKAIMLYEMAQKAFKQNPSMTNVILNSLAYAYEKNGNNEKAISCFEKVASGSETIMKADALYHLGTLYAAQGDTDKSREAFGKIVSEHTDSVFVKIAQEKITG